MQSQVIECQVQVRYRDLDTFDHVNNAVFLSYFEHARAVMLVDLYRKYNIRFVIAHLCIDYHKPAFLLDTLTVRMWVSKIGKTSWEFQYELKRENELLATGSSVQVYINTQGQKQALPDYLRERLQMYLVQS